MRRGPKPAKSKEAKPPVGRKAPKSDGAKLRDLEKRLAEALKGKAEAQEQQTATAEILRVISQSQTDIQPVFDAIVASAVRLLEADSGLLTRIAGDQIEIAALTSTDPAGDAILRAAYPLSRHSDRVHARVIRDRAPLNVADSQTDPRLPDVQHATARARGYRSQVVVPLLRHAEAVGAIAVTRREPGGFTEDEIALLQTFADQAVIAIENVRLFNETKEALEQQTATSEILGVISQSPTDLQPVFDAIVSSAERLCHGVWAALYRSDGTRIHLAAIDTSSPEALLNPGALEMFRHSFPIPAGDSSSMVARAMAERRVVSIADVDAVPDLPARARAASLSFGFRSCVFVPLFRDGAVIGAIGQTRREPNPFTEREIELLKTFGDQAVIAIENVRLFTELQEKNRALTQAHAQVTESLEQQTATAEILRVISSSPTDEQPVFDAIVQSARGLCEATYSVVFLVDAGQLVLKAVHGVDESGIAALQQAYPLAVGRDTTSGRAIIDRGVVHVPDSWRDSEYAHPLRDTIALRSILSVPIFRDGQPIGAISVWRGEARAFTDKQVALLQTFTEQAVIAIENVRLFRELQASNRELTTALDTQTATSDILRVISGSQTDVQPVFDAIVTSAVRLLAGTGAR